MIVITMAGGSSRFLKAGYDKTKYALELWDKSVFEQVLLSFKKYFLKEDFLFITRRDDLSSSKVHLYVRNLGIQNYDVFELDKVTDGQAETAYLALKEYSDDFPILIFNIDTIRPNYIFPSFIDQCDGYLEVFKGEGSNWSFIEPDVQGSNKVLRTAEKDPISNLCSSGMYYFKSKNLYCYFFEKNLKMGNKSKGEYYIAPLYNDYIKQGFDIKYELIEQDNIYFCGTPDEYEALKRRGKSDA